MQNISFAKVLCDCNANLFDCCLLGVDVKCLEVVSSTSLSTSCPVATLIVEFVIPLDSYLWLSKLTFIHVASSKDWTVKAKRKEFIFVQKRVHPSTPGGRMSGICYGEKWQHVIGGFTCTEWIMGGERYMAKSSICSRLWGIM